MNTQTIKRFEVLDTELLASVNGGQAMPPLHGGGGNPGAWSEPKPPFPGPDMQYGRRRP